MDLVTGMKTFVAAVETGSFTAAADRLHLSPKLVSKYVAQLEERLDVRLLHRTTRQLSITSVGQVYYAGAAKIIEDLDALETEVRTDASSLSGTLRLTAPATFGQLYLQPLLLRFAQENPELTLDLHLNDRFVDLAEEGFDLAIRFGMLSETNMIARRLGSTEMWCVASPEYLSQHGEPSSTQDLKNFSCIRDSNARFVGNWPFYEKERLVRVPVHGPFVVNSALSVRNLAIEGQGIGLCLDFVVAKDVQQGRLVRVLPETRSVDLDIHAVFLENKHLPRRVRSFLDFLAAEFKAKPNWNDWQRWKSEPGED